MSDDSIPDSVRPRLCHIIKWADFNGFGFNLHAERGKAGQYIGKVDDDSPAESAGLKSRDRIVEVNGANIANENHQQVVLRIKAGGDEVKLLVVDEEADQYYRDEKKVIRGDLPEVRHLRSEARPGQTENDQHDEEPPEEPELNSVSHSEAVTPSSEDEKHRPRYCHIRKWDDFDGYGFNLHAEKDKPGQFIGKIDDDSPAEAAHLREDDRIIEVNGDNIEEITHQEVILKIKAGGNETRLLVVDRETDAYYKARNIRVHGNMPQVAHFSTPLTSGKAPTATDREESAADQGQRERESNNVDRPEVDSEPDRSLARTSQAAEELQADSIPHPNAAEKEEETGTVENGSSEMVKENITTEVSRVRETTGTDDHERPVNGQPKTVSTPKTSTTPNGDSMGLSAKEMRERIAAKKRSDPRNQKVDFKTKHQMFEKM